MPETQFADLAGRMKWYEKNNNHAVFTDAMPVVARVDGRAFHTYTKNFDKPFDKQLRDTLNAAATHVGSELQSLSCIYAQSDEVSFILYSDKPQLEMGTRLPWGGKRDKINSLVASEFTAQFAALSMKLYNRKVATFDCRSFQLPSVSELSNYLLWRRQDWARNFIQMIARSKYSHKQCMNLSCDTLFQKLNNDFPGLIDSYKEFRNGFFFGNTSVS